jgi:hypothetical protein
MVCFSGVVGQRRGNNHDHCEKAGITLPLSRASVRWERSYGAEFQFQCQFQFFQRRHGVFQFLIFELLERPDRIG